jgi:hypothetical protein
MSIDTHVDADPASCRATAQWLDGVARAGAGAADGVVGARNVEFSWVDVYDLVDVRVARTR